MNPEVVANISAVAAVFSAIAAVAIVVASFLQSDTSKKQWETSEKQQKLLERQVELEENYRKISQKPLIIIPFNIIITGGKSLNIQISNTGSIPIHDITFFFYFKRLENNGYNDAISLDIVSKQIIDMPTGYDKQVRISELYPQRSLRSYQQLDKGTMQDLVNIANHNTKLTYDQKASNEYQRMYFIVFGAIKYKGTNDNPEVKEFFELVEFTPEYNTTVKSNQVKGKVDKSPATIPPHVNFIGTQYPVQLESANKRNILEFLNYTPEFQ